MRPTMTMFTACKQSRSGRPVVRTIIAGDYRSGPILSGGVLYECEINPNIYYRTVSNTRFVGCCFGGDFRDMKFVDCTFDGCLFIGASIFNNVSMYNCMFKGVNVFRRNTTCSIAFYGCTTRNMRGLWTNNIGTTMGTSAILTSYLPSGTSIRRVNWDNEPDMYAIHFLNVALSSSFTVAEEQIPQSLLTV